MCNLKRHVTFVNNWWFSWLTSLGFLRFKFASEEESLVVCDNCPYCDNIQLGFVIDSEIENHVYFH